MCLGGTWTMMPEQEKGEGTTSAILTFGFMVSYEKLIETVAPLSQKLQQKSPLLFFF